MERRIGNAGSTQKTCRRNGKISGHSSTNTDPPIDLLLLQRESTARQFHLDRTDPLKLTPESSPVIVLWGIPLDLNTDRIAAQLNQLNPTKVKTGEVDINAYPQLAMRFSVRNSPFLMIVVNGLTVAQGTSLTPEILQQVTG